MTGRVKRTSARRLGSQSGFIHRKGAAWQVSPTLLPLLTPGWHERTTISGLLGAGPLLTGEARLGPAQPVRGVALRGEACRERPRLGRQDLRRDFNPGPTVKAGCAILLAALFLISHCFMFLAALFSLSCCQQGRQCGQSRSSCRLEPWGSRHAGRTAGGEQARGWD